MVSNPLRERMRQALRIRNMSPRTERIYLDFVARFAAHFRLSPDRLGLPQIEQYLLFLRDVKSPLPQHRDLHPRLAGSGPQPSGQAPASTNAHRVIHPWAPRPHSAQSPAPRVPSFSPRARPPRPSAR